MEGMGPMSLDTAGQTHQLRDKAFHTTEFRETRFGATCQTVWAFYCTLEITSACDMNNLIQV